MRTKFRTASIVNVAILLLGIVCVSDLAAQCGSFNNAEAFQPRLWQGQPQLMQASFSPVWNDHDPIVGFWKAKFVSGRLAVKGARADARRLRRP